MKLKKGPYSEFWGGAVIIEVKRYPAAVIRWIRLSCAYRGETDRVLVCHYLDVYFNVSYQFLCYPLDSLNIKHNHTGRLGMAFP
jgi:hypothetical protein